MKRIKALLICSAVIVGTLGGMEAPASAAPASISFQCDMTLVWPGSGSAYCPGTVTKVSVEGQPVPCVPLCPFAAGVDTYSTTCVGTGVPILAEGWADIYIAGVNMGDAHFLLVGTNLYFLADGDWVGTGVWTPLPPLMTCAAPGLQTVHITGQISRT
jgi:hypothetical protein